MLCRFARTRAGDLVYFGRGVAVGMDEWGALMYYTGQDEEPFVVASAALSRLVNPRGAKEVEVKKDEVLINGTSMLKFSPLEANLERYERLRRWMEGGEVKHEAVLCRRPDLSGWATKTDLRPVLPRNVRYSQDDLVVTLGIVEDRLILRLKGVPPLQSWTIDKCETRIESPVENFPVVFLTLRNVLRLPWKHGSRLQLREDRFLRIVDEEFLCVVNPVKLK
jgi:hypothetical protein